MQEVPNILQKKDKICSLTNEWGFNTDKTHPPKIYPNLYKGSGKAGLCLLVVDTNPQISPTRRHHLLGYELAKLLGCKVQVGGIENIYECSQGTALATAISLFAPQHEIIAHYTKLRGEHYKFSPVDLEEERVDLGFSNMQEAEEEIQQLKQMIVDAEASKLTSKAPSSLFFQVDPLSQPASSSSASSSQREEDCQLLIKILNTNPLAAAILKKDVNILLEVHQRLKAAKIADVKGSKATTPGS